MSVVVRICIRELNGLAPERTPKRCVRRIVSGSNANRANLSVDIKNKHRQKRNVFWGIK